MDPAKTLFLFGSTTQVADPLDKHQRERAFARFLRDTAPPDAPPEAFTAMITGLEVVARQVLAGGESPVWRNVERLLKTGMSRRHVLSEVGPVAHAALDMGFLDEARPEELSEVYVAGLAMLPLPSRASVEAVLPQLFDKTSRVPLDDLSGLLVDELGLFDGAGDSVVNLMGDILAETIEDIIDDLVEQGALLCVRDDFFVYPPALFENKRVTHRLTALEIEMDYIDAGFDFGMFDDIDTPLLDGGGTITRSTEPERRGDWHGPAGWLNAFRPGDVIMATRHGNAVVFEVIAQEEPAAGKKLDKAVRRAYDDLAKKEDVPVTGQMLAISMVLRDASALSSPGVPLSEVCTSIGLERRQSAVAHDEKPWRVEQRIHMYGAVLASLPDDPGDRRGRFETAAKVCASIIDGAQTADVKTAVSALADPAVCDAIIFAVVREIARDRRFQDVAFDFAERATEIAGRSVEKAAAWTLFAAVLECAGQWDAAEDALVQSMTADHRWPMAAARLAWYASDRGDADRALQLWRSAGVNARNDEDVRTIEATMQTRTDLSRNSPCWCGSGKKYKFCHNGKNASLALADRFDWIAIKLSMYLYNYDDVLHGSYGNSLDRLGGRALDERTRSLIASDVALFNAGALDRFLSGRAELLPDDERALLGEWRASRRSVFEVRDYLPGRSVTLSDVRTGDTLEVVHAWLPAATVNGSFVCTRPVPDCEQFRLVGGVISVNASEVEAMFEAIDQGADTFVDLVSTLAQTSPLQTREGEASEFSEAIVSVPDADSTRTFLDSTYTYEPEADGWVETHRLDDNDTVLRSSLRLYEDSCRIVVNANSDKRMRRVIDTVTGGIDGAFLLMTEVRPINLSGDSFDDDDRADGSAGAFTSPEDLPPEVVEQLHETMESRWLSEAVPALGGLTPFEAARHPGRRSDLMRLLDQFEHMPVPQGAFSFRVEKLRERLGL